MQLKYLPTTDVVHAFKIAKLDAAHQTLEQIRTEVTNGSEKCWTRVQKLLNAKTNAMPANFMLGDYVIILQHMKREHKLQPAGRGSMRIIEVKTDMVLVVEDLLQLH